MVGKVEAIQESYGYVESSLLYIVIFCLLCMYVLEKVFPEIYMLGKTTIV